MKYIKNKQAVVWKYFVLYAVEHKNEVFFFVGLSLKDRGVLYVVI